MSVEQKNITIEDQFSVIHDSLSNLSSGLKTMQVNLKNLSKTVKVAEKKSRHKPKSPPKPMNINKDLATFLKISTEPISKAQVMKHISTYVKNNNLQVENDRRHFIPNKPLMKIFKMSEPVSMTFVEINKYVSHHLTAIEN